MTRETVANVAPFTPREEVQDAIASATHYFTSALQKKQRKLVVLIQSRFDTSRFHTTSSTEVTHKFRSLQV